ncbi:hypothetical protein [Streptomyces sp. NPDC088350]|uniref:hypothetical protein n=1 Tax=Streptomyces sp. NPDC088350 TaxID=3365854 RepID=UPI0038156197
MSQPTPATPAATAEDRALDALVNVIQTAASPAAQEAQLLLLRRLALEGDVIPSRAPAPLNITQTAGLFNLLEDLGQRTTALQALSSVLGVAGPAVAPPQGSRLLTFTALANDRPAGAAGPTAPTTVPVRADLVAGLQTVLAAVHQVGAVLPLWASPALPALSDATDPLEACGRQLRVLPTAALADPTTDSIVLGREIGGVATGYDLFARPDPGNPATAALPERDMEGAVLAPGPTPMTVHLGLVRLLPLRPLLGAAGWVTTPAAALPTGPADLGWSRMVNLSGLLPGVSRLGAELDLVRYPGEVDGTPFAAKTDWVWNGTEFTAPGA